MKPEKQMRIIQIYFVVFAGLLIWLAYRLPSHTTQKPNLAFEIIIGIVAMACALNGFRFQKRTTRAASRSANSNDPTKELKVWRAGHILRLAFHISVSLYGFVLHMLGGAAWLVDVLLAGGSFCLRPGSQERSLQKCRDLVPLNS